MATLNHLSKTGRTPISPDQALAICCEIQAVNYVETSAKVPLDNNISEAFELCALASITSKTKPQKGQQSSTHISSSGNSAFKRSPSINSSLSLFEPMPSSIVTSMSEHLNGNCNNNLVSKKSNYSVASNGNGAGQLRHSYRYQANLIAPPPLNSPSSFSECDARLSTFSPEPLRLPDQPPPPPPPPPGDSCGIS